MAFFPRRGVALVMASVISIGSVFVSNARGGCPAPMPAFAGVYPTVLTPFCDHGIDLAALETQLHYQLAGGVDGLLVLGTIGEGEYVTMAEREQVIAAAVHLAGPHRPVVAGIHTCHLEVARVQMLQARRLGAAAVLIKYVGHPAASAAEVTAFFAKLCDLHALPILYYHFPSDTGLRLRPEDIGGIVSLPGVVGIKETTLDLREVEAHLHCVSGMNKTFFTGTALDLTQFLDLGGHGAMCPEAAILPGPTVQAYVAWMHGRHDEARHVQSELFAMTPILQTRPTPPALNRTVVMTALDHKAPLPTTHDQPQARLKAALNCLGVPTSAAVKPPLPPLTRCENRRVATAASRLKAIDWLEVALTVPPVPSTTVQRKDGAGLLDTGYFLLGPGAGNTYIRLQGDGHAGFRD